MTPQRASRQSARRFARRALLLDTPAPDAASALDHLGWVQIDPINVCGRMHDLILRNRVAGYRAGDLLAHIHSPQRPGFEHYLPGSSPVLAAWPAGAWRWLSPLILARRLRGGVYGRKLGRKNEAIARRILEEISERGPLTSSDIEHDGRSLTGWGTMGRLVKNLLEIMFVQGRVLISGRRNFRRVYDLPERVLPAAAASSPEKDRTEILRWLVVQKLRQRRLVALKKAELPLVDDLVAELAVEDCPPLYCLSTDLPLLDSSRSEAPSMDPLLLAPLDPLIYDRRMTSALWRFDYTWEAYTPRPKRVRGYFALPVLAGTEIVGHVDAMAERAVSRLRVVSRRAKRPHRTAPAVRKLACFLGLAS